MKAVGKINVSSQQFEPKHKLQILLAVHHHVESIVLFSCNEAIDYYYNQNYDLDNLVGESGSHVEGRMVTWVVDRCFIMWVPPRH